MVLQHFSNEQRSKHFNSFRIYTLVLQLWFHNSIHSICHFYENSTSDSLVKIWTVFMTIILATVQKEMILNITWEMIQIVWEAKIDTSGGDVKSKWVIPSINAIHLCIWINYIFSKQSRMRTIFVRCQKLGWLFT